MCVLSIKVPIRKKKSLETYLMILVYTPFLNGISLQVNAIVRLEIELAYCDATIQHISHNSKNILNVIL